MIQVFATHVCQAKDFADEAKDDGEADGVDGEVETRQLNRQRDVIGEEAILFSEDDA